MKKARELSRRDKVTEATTLQGEGELDGDMVKTLIDPNEGLLQAGALPAMGCSNPAGQKALMDGLCEAGAQAVPKQKKPKTDAEKSEPAKPKTYPEKAVDLMAEVLAESTSARKKSMSLGEVNYAGELANELLAHAVKMEKHYRTLQNATKKKVEDKHFYKKAFDVISKDREWFVTAQAAADSILSGLKRAKNKKKDADGAEQAAPKKARGGRKPK
ncbi:Uncharacterized protein SCF082_LOCUS8217 [Durusdinium trenchii]|uniref:Uncharacterized protein n=1 Tax=Durusdinium trenchii TaxID=1381693 RepID=A0ABP0ISB9_9DINO